MKGPKGQPDRATPDPKQQLTYDMEFEARFRHHPPNNQWTIDAHQAVRQVCHVAAAHMLNYVPRGREQALAITKIEEAMMWANAAIARRAAADS